MNNQALRNLTTGKLHTEMSEIYKSIEFITGEEGIMTHMLPAAFKALQPWLKEHVVEPRFWNGKYDTSHTGEYPLSPMSDEEREYFFAAFTAQPDPLEGKEVINVLVS